MDANQALEKLKEGNVKYVNNGSVVDATDAVRSTLTSGQSPYAIILSCADSRVIPESIFNANAGEVFVTRVAGNTANDSTVASIEYAVAHLGTKLILVLGHESCGAVTAAIGKVNESPCLNHLLDQIQPAVAQADSSDVNVVVKENAQLQAKQLLAKSEILRNAEGLKIVSGFYNLSSGAVDILA